MNWIKKNYALFCLAIMALVLLGVSAFLILNASSFNQNFSSIQGSVQQNNKIQTVDQSALDAAIASLATPKLWTTTGTSGLLFVSRQYLVKDGGLVNPREKDGLMLHPPVPNAWFDQHNLDLLDNDVLNEDPDKDGFTNYDEWVGMNPANPGSQPTDPNDPNSHPAYITKLKLKRFIKKPFRLLFNAYDGDPAHPEAMSFQINTVDIKQPTLFPKLNDTIEGTKFKIVKFEFKKNTDANNIDHDVSELTLENNENKDLVKLVLEKVVDSPDSYALFKYQWDGSEMVVKKEKTFSLKPEIDVQYKLIDIQENEALIQNLKTGAKIKIPRVAD